MKFTHRNAQFASSPYKGTTRFLHFLMLDMADEDTGLLWPKQKTLAEVIGASLSWVEKSIARFVKDGWLEVVKRTKACNIYRVIVKSNPDSSTGSNPDSSTGSNPYPSAGSYIEKNLNENRKGTKPPSAPRRGQDQDMADSFGSKPSHSDFDQPQPGEEQQPQPQRQWPKRPPKTAAPKQRVTAKWNERMWDLGITRWNQGHLSNLLGTMAREEHTWDQIEQIMIDFLDQNEQKILSEQGRYDPVALFHSALNRGLGQIRYPSPTVAASTGMFGGQGKYAREEIERNRGIG